MFLEGNDGYKYEWTLISHPEGDDETGTMEDQNTKNLKLSKVRKKENLLHSLSNDFVQNFNFVFEMNNIYYH